MDPFQTPGAFSWCELATGDPAKASEFYGSLLGWKFDVMDMGQGPYRVIKVGEAAIGGVMAFPPGSQAMPPNWGCYVTVVDCDKTSADAQKLGGKLCNGPFDIPGVGRMAVLQDPQGAVFSVIQYKTP
jgi:hypothetical protein